MGANGKVFSYIIMQFFSILQINRFYVMIMTLWHLFLNRKKLGSPKSFFHVTKEVQQIFFNISIWPRAWGQTERFQNYPLKMGKFDFKNCEILFTWPIYELFTKFKTKSSLDLVYHVTMTAIFLFGRGVSVWPHFESGGI